MKTPKFNVKNILMAMVVLLPLASNAQDYSPKQANIFFEKNFKYQGAFRIPNRTFGESRIAYTRGVFTLSSDINSFFIVGHSQHQAIAEFTIPPIVNSRDLDDLSFATPKQNFIKILNSPPTGNTQHIDYITGMDIIENNLFINAIEYYDANANATFTTIIVDQPTHLDKSKIRGYFELTGGTHAAGWISELPKDLKNTLYGSHIVGSASNFPINTRSSIGPTMFISNLDVYANNKQVSDGLIPAKAILDFSLKHPLHDDPYNKIGQNRLWTEISNAIYGFIIPNTHLYLVIGTSGGHNSGIGYKITQDNGRECGGPCSKNSNDVYNYMWLWDADKLTEQDKLTTLHLPDIYGELSVEPELTNNHRIIGADFDFLSSKLYVLIGSADKQSEYESAPLMLVYTLIPQ